MVIGIFPSAEETWVGLSPSCVLTALRKDRCAGKFPAAGRTGSTEPLLHAQSPFPAASQCHLHHQDGAKAS